MARSGTLVSEFTEAEKARIFAMLMADGTFVRRSKLGPWTVVVNGLTDADACGDTTADAFRVLLDEEDGYGSPGRLVLSINGHVL